jgi:hypothetical protein
VSDLFPKIKEEPVDYGALEESIRNVCNKRNLKDVDGECGVYVWKPNPNLPWHILLNQGYRD